MVPELMTTTIGWSTHTDPLLAGREAAERAARRLSLHAPKLAIVFGSSWFDQRLLVDGVRSITGSTPLIGASTAGEIVPEGPISHSCVVVLIASNTLSIHVGMGEGMDRAPREAGRQAAALAIRDFNGASRRGFLLLADGLFTSYADVIRGLQEVLGTSFLIVGGMAGDDLRFTQTYQYCNDRVMSRSVVGALFGGPLTIGLGCEHGFAPISKPRQITRSYANVLIQLDGHPAASVYEEYFGHDVVERLREEGLTRQGIAYPLGMRSETTGQWLLRNVVSFGEDGSLVCSGEVREGTWLQLMIGSKDLALEAAYKAAQQATRSMNRIGCVLIFDSAVRRMLLGSQHAALEISRIREAIGPTVPLAGCYTYGEQAPLGTAMTYEQITTQTGSVLVVALGG